MQGAPTTPDADLARQREVVDAFFADPPEWAVLVAGFVPVLIGGFIVWRVLEICGVDELLLRWSDGDGSEGQ